MSIQFSGENKSTLWMIFVSGLRGWVNAVKSMGRAGKALKQTLLTYGISQNQLAAAMGIGHANISRWVNEVRDPGGETILEIRAALGQINWAAAEEFIRLYLEQPRDED